MIKAPTILVGLALLCGSVAWAENCPKDRLVIANAATWGAQDYNDFQMVARGYAEVSDLQSKKRAWPIPENTLGCLNTPNLPVPGAVSVSMTLQGLPLDLYVDGTTLTQLGQR